MEEEEAKLHIEAIRTQRFGIGSNQPNLRRALSNLPKDANFLRELILNAEENEYEENVVPELRFVMTEKDITKTGAPATLLVFNNEVGFSKENMECICSMFRSTKQGKRQHTHGKGFKSVFLVSSQPYIFSNGYHVRFQEEPDQECGVGYIVPQWVSEHPSISSISDALSIGTPATTIILPLKPEMVDSVREQMSQLCPEILLFLSKLKHLYVCDVANRVSRFRKDVDSDGVRLSRKKMDDDTEESCHYYLRKNMFPVKPENRFGVRMDVQNWEITIAFPSEERMRMTTSSVGIFAFLPTTMVTDFPFLIQADFILNSSRDSMLLDNAWNLGILSCISSAFVNAFTSLSLGGPLQNIFDFLPAQASSIPQFNDLRESIRTELQTMEMVPCYVRPQEVVRVRPEFRCLMHEFEREGYVLSRTSESLLMMYLHQSLDLEKHDAVLEYVGVKYADDHWYTECIQSLCSSADKKITGAGVILLLKYIDSLSSISPDDPFLRFLKKIIAKSKCLKTWESLHITKSCMAPEECILLDPDWESDLDRELIPSIDEDFHGHDIRVYKNQLRDIGVKVDPLSVCSLLHEFLKYKAICRDRTQPFVQMIYKFLNKCQWRPEDEITKVYMFDGYFYRQNCVLHDEQHLFPALLASLDEYFDDELLTFFSSAYGIPENPTPDHYIDNWNTWDGLGNVTLEKYCFAFWMYVVDNWFNPDFQEKLSQELTMLPATKSTSEEIYQINKEEVFIADDLQLKSIFLSYEEAPLFVWFPSSNYLWGKSLSEIYEHLGVRKLSDSVDTIPSTLIDLDTEAQVLHGLIKRGLIKIILGFLAGSQVNMSFEDRKDAASSVIKVTVYKLNKPYQQIYRLMRPECESVDVRKVKLITWKIESEQLIIDNSKYNNGKPDARFVAALADELAQGLLEARHCEARASLSTIIQTGFQSDFSEQEVDHLLMSENLKLSVEDEKFLDAEFLSSTISGPVSRKRSSMERDESSPSTSTG